MRTSYHPLMQQSLDGEACALRHTEIVMGLRWRALSVGRPQDAAADLDALCVLYGQGRRVLEIIHPSRPRNANGSVIHTGDSPSGGSGKWDDERIFVFLNALPEEVSALSFAVTIASGRPFAEAERALCHISDRISEEEIFRTDLAVMWGRRPMSIASLSRRSGSWAFSPGGVLEKLPWSLLTLAPPFKPALDARQDH